MNKPLFLIEDICNSGKTSKIVNFFLVEKPVVILENICKCFLVDFFVTAPVFQTEIARRPAAMSQTTRTFHPPEQIGNFLHCFFSGYLTPRSMKNQLHHTPNQLEYIMLRTVVRQ
jgi:hypothetical protein